MPIGIEIYRSIPVSTVALSVEARPSQSDVDLVSPTAGLWVLCSSWMDHMLFTFWPLCPVLLIGW